MRAELVGCPAVRRGKKTAFYALLGIGALVMFAVLLDLLALAFVY
jgi:hypothetical protein